MSSSLVRSLPRGAGSWVVMGGEGVVGVGKPAPPARMAATAGLVVRAERAIVYGAVLPWRGVRARHAQLVLSGETSGGAFARVLGEQPADVRALVDDNPGTLVVWAGDFNHAMTGPNFAGTTRGRSLLRGALDSVGFRAWNHDAAPAPPALRAVDPGARRGNGQSRT